MREKLYLDISISAIVKIVIAILLLLFLYTVRDILALFVVVVLLVATFSPWVEKLSKKIGRPLSVFTVLAGVIIVISAAIYLIVPPMINQISQLTTNLPEYADKVAYLKDYAPDLTKNLSSLTQASSQISESIFSFTKNFFGGVFTFVIAIVLFIYLLIDEKAFKNFLISLFPDRKKHIASNLFRKVANKVGDWFGGQMMLCGIIGVVDLIGLLIIGIPYAITLAVISAILEIVPTIGPIIAGLAAAAVALTISPVKAVLVIILYIIVQQLENAVVVPKIMQKAVGLSPVIIIFSILVGARLLGIVGAILAVPISAALSVLLQERKTLLALIRSDE